MGREVRGGEGECTYWYEGEGDGGVWKDGVMEECGWMEGWGDGGVWVDGRMG